MKKRDKGVGREYSSTDPYRMKPDPELPLSRRGHSMGDGSFEGRGYESRKPKCKHNYEFKYKEDKVTEQGDIIKQEHYFCKRCLEDKVVEK